MSLSKTLYTLLGTGSTLEMAQHDKKMVDLDIIKTSPPQNIVALACCPHL